MSCVPKHILEELGVSRRKLGHFIMEGRNKMTWNHVLSGAAIHLLGRNQMCSCEASHVCQSCQGQDDRLRAVNAKLLAALEPFAALLLPHVEANAFQGDDTGVFGINQVKITVGDLRRAREAIEEARK